jgi:hypothetical protein
MRLVRAAFLLGLVCLSLSATARAADTEQCPTFLPDFRCDRHGRWDGFTAPVSMPFYFEDPFITTGLYTWGVWHEFPTKSAFQGGDAYLVAAQLRIALTDRLGLIATQDGYAWMYPKNSLLDDSSGWMNYMFGLKYALYENKEAGFIASASVRFKTSWSSASIYQQGGKGGWLPGMSLAWGADKVHLIADAGGYLPMDGGAESTFAFYNLHVDYAVTPILSPFVELNGISYTDDGNGHRPIKLANGASIPLSTAQSVLGTGGFEAVDFANLGSKNVAGQTYLTWALGLRCKLSPHSSIGIAYERPFTSDKEITLQRGTLSLDFEL